MKSLIQLRFGLLITVLLCAQTLPCAFGSGRTLPQNSPNEAAKDYSVLVGSKAPQLEIFAAEELSKYLHQLYGLQVHLTHSPNPNADFFLLVGSPCQGG